MRARTTIGGVWRGVAVVAAAAALAATALVAYRVFAPAEVLTPAGTSYPDPGAPAPGVLGTLTGAPLIVDGRLRVFAASRQVRAEQPVDAATRRTPFWSYRRWPEQLVGVVAIDATVVSQWTDGELVALDATTGKIAWRTLGPAIHQEYAGRSTGASTVYAPPAMYAATTLDGRSVLVAAGAEGRRGYDPATGQELWRDRLAGRCRRDEFTTTTGQLATVNRCVQPEAVEFTEVATGAGAGRWRPDGAGATLVVQPVGCRVGRSDCPAMRTGEAGNTQGWLFDPAAKGSHLVPAVALNDPGSTLVDGMIVVPEGAGVVGRAAGTGAEAWRWAAGEPVQLLAVQPGRAHLRTRSGELVTLDVANGRERSRFRLTYGRDSTRWSPGYAYAADGYLAVERLTEPVAPEADDRRYYLNIQPVIFAAT